MISVLIVISAVLLMTASNAYRMTKIKRFIATSSTTLSDLKYDPKRMTTVELKRPLGLSLEENIENQPRGVYVAEIKEGSAKESGKIIRGMYLIDVDGTDVKNLDFDSIMDAITSKPEGKSITMSFIEFKDVYKGPAIVKATKPDGSSITIKCLKGQSLRDVLLGAGLDVYSGKSKLTNCGGGGVCGTCVVGVLASEWEDRPLFEAQKLKKYDTSCRLSCNTKIEGDCEVIMSPKKN